jgi:hypothetical protein
MLRPKWVVPITGSTGSALVTASPFQLSYHAAAGTIPFKVTPASLGKRNRFTTPSWQLSMMMDSFSSSVQSRRRSTPVMTSTRGPREASVLTLRLKLVLKRWGLMAQNYARSRGAAAGGLGASLTEDLVPQSE